ncbi:hypothetical protein F5B19DRAFT_438120 [Rostrohypoxylon terebratum]|nr:hypothetical protein F5B19DRAFT_438120 [Rostrohypoxylon terebratum]
MRRRSPLFMIIIFSPFTLPAKPLWTLPVLTMTRTLSHLAYYWGGQISAVRVGARCKGVTLQHSLQVHHVHVQVHIHDLEENWPTAVNLEPNQYIEPGSERA